MERRRTGLSAESAFTANLAAAKIMADVIRVPYEAARDIEGDPETHTLSARTQMIVLSQTAYLHWKARWYRQDGAELSDSDKEDIEDWASKAEDELLVATAPGSDEVGTPFWDDVVEVDDEAAPADQVWYGEVDDPTVVPTEETFRETLEDWTFAGLLAIGGAPGAALAFLTIAPKFRLAFKQGDIGKIIHIFVDASEVKTIEQDGSGDEVEVAIVGDPDLETHQIYITLEGA